MNMYTILRSVLIGGALGTALGILTSPSNMIHALVFGSWGTFAGALTALLAALCLPSPHKSAKDRNDKDS